MPDIEVEAKYRLCDTADDWRARLVALGASALAPVRQSDEYFAHPARDFVATGEAFRIRTVGESNALTYKGPLLDAATKSRRELEIGVAPGDRQARCLREMLLALGFLPAGRVRKCRTPLEIDWRQRRISLALDDVDGLGTYLELEIVTTECDWTDARDVVLALAAQLGLEQSERRSYLELLRSTGRTPDAE